MKIGDRVKWKSQSRSYACFSLVCHWMANGPPELEGTGMSPVRDTKPANLVFRAEAARRVR